MSPWEVVTRVVVPVLLVLWAGFVFVGVFADRPETFSRPRGWHWVWAALWLGLAGEAAIGDDRSWVERTWKGVMALLLTVAVVVAAVRRHRWKARQREADG
ncbi:hypothetical protein [Micromonospora chokoriensis]|uniref:Uncharacterized protein n=1 Tax=Micromonospora chokoriensis TaxID=356851 RepID=A0A1C4X783_9ACTN|nr:hypothetical protein [Micromonospora chokoriensis]SCF04353.1 hypothetical protein GA0070612_3264 [Micromonospora chokoriensis]